MNSTANISWRQFVSIGGALALSVGCQQLPSSQSPPVAVQQPPMAQQQPLAQPQQREPWTQADDSACLVEFRNSFVKSSGGQEPPAQMAQYYCDCARAAYNSGSSITDATGFCIQAVQSKTF